MLRNVYLKSLRDLRRSLAWWAVGLCGLVAVEISVYPTVRDDPGLNKLVQEYPDVLKAFISFGGTVDYVSGAGYLGSELFAFMLPLLFLVAAIGNGAGSLAAEQERGTLDLLLSHPVTRQRVALEKFAAMVTEVVLLGLVLWTVLWIGARATGMAVSAWELAAATVMAVALALVFGGLAFMLGAATGQRAVAIGGATAVAVAAYLVNSLAVLVDHLEPFQKVSPFYHYAVGDPLRQGLPLIHLGLLLAGVLVTASIGVAAFCRRDI